MSRWTDAFDRLGKGTIDPLLVQVEVVMPDDLSAMTAVGEITRLKKIVTYINEVLNSLDPELVPLASWEQFSAQGKNCLSEISGYQTDRVIGHIQNANTHADNMLNYVRPYMILKGKAKSVHENLFAKTQKDLESYLDSFQDEATEKLKKINKTLVESSKSKEELDAISTNILEFNIKLFGEEEDQADPDELGGLEKIFDYLHNEAVNQAADISGYHSTLLIDTPKQKAIKTEIADTQKVVKEAKDIVLTDVGIADKEIRDLEAFYIKIFGKLNDDDETEGGLSEEITTRLTLLRELESSNKIRYDAVVQKIQDLLPGATSAGLATAYNKMKKSFTATIVRFERIFFISIGILIILTVASSISFKITPTEAGYQFTYDIIKYSTFDEAFRVNLFKLPLYGALIWLVFFASKRRSEAQRLQQEYAHKEALAKSYGSYKQQLEDLDMEDKELQKEFIKKTIDAITYNASQTLDGEHGDNYPAKDFLEKLMSKFPEMKIEDFKGLFRK